MAYSGVYKGIRFRSLLELSVIRHFESEGLVADRDFTYEQTIVEYGKTRKRNYIVDLTFPEHKLLVEIKPASRAENRNNRAKRAGAEKWCEENGWEYLIITDEELRQCGELLTLEQVAQMPEVELNERAKRANRRKLAAKARKRRKK
jgi:hypothetical protein